VGSLGWHHKPIVQKFRPWVESGDTFFLEDVSAGELRLLYKHARATVCPSFGEGFGLSGVEAMASGGVVVASSIKAHREIYADAAEYFDPYSAEDLVRAIRDVIDAPASRHREALIARGRSVAQRYGERTILPKWQTFLTSTLAECDAVHVSGQIRA
jgi:glycosyltransferase involved in cell wall biosynthesis